MKKKFLVKILSLFGLLLSSCTFFDLFAIKVETVYIEAEKNQIFVDEELQLEPTVFPSNAKNKEITWKSENETIVSVTQKGLVRGLKEGNTTVQAISKQNPSIKGTFKLSVIQPTLESISVKTKPKTLRYYEDEYFNPSGLVINGEYNDGSSRAIEYNTHKSEFTFVPNLSTPLTLETDSISIKYKDKTTHLNIIVREPGSLETTKMAYTYDDYKANNLFNAYPNYKQDNCPLEGSPKLLVIPIWFNDSTSFIDASKKDGVRNDIQKAYIGNPSDTGWHSVKSYYEAESFGKVTLNATVTDWYSVNKSYEYYAESSGYYYTSSLVKTASDSYFNNHPSDSRKNYDTNNDGYLDGVILIYAAPENDSLSKPEYENLWAYCNWTGATSNTTTPVANVFFWASYDFLYGSNANQKTGHNYARGYTEYGVTIDTHCFIHEMGHVFGLEDYYDYSNQCVPAGGFSMQDYNVGGHDPYSVMAYGWADPYIPDRSVTFTLGNFQEFHDVILLSNHDLDLEKPSPFDEYLLIEYYTPDGLNNFDSIHRYRDYYPQGPNRGGIRLWHVDARLFSRVPEIANITTIPDDYVYHMMSNSYGGDNPSYFGEDYYNYNILQLIRNDEYGSYRPTDNLSDDTLFLEGDSFDMSTYGSQFVNTGRMNDGESLGWSFTVDSINDAGATITITKV